MIIAEESFPQQTENKLDQSLDALAALRKAMKERLAEAKAAQEAAAARAAREEAAIEAEKREAEIRIAQKEIRAAIRAAEEKAAQAQAEADAMRQTVESRAAIEKAAKDALANATIDVSVHPQTEAPRTTGQENANPETVAGIHFDIVEWTRIMIRVAQESQKLIRNYIVRTRDKPVDMVPFTPTPILDSVSRLATKFLDNPEAYTEAQLATWQNYIDITRATMLRLQGVKTPPVAEAAANDKRFKAKDWQTNWMFDFMKQTYLSTADETRRLVQQEASNVSDKMAKKLEFYSRLFLDASAPNNFWLTNPEVLRATLDSKGENLIKGLQNLLQDLEQGNGFLRIRMSDYNAFQLGKNIAVTPGKVVYQNELMQLIQYSPQTETVHRVPFLIIPPWINKYYILDLREKNSFIKNLVSQGHTVFCISWVNPTKDHANVQFEDYMDKGSLVALREVKNRTGQEDVNVLGYCIGGTLLSCTQAYMAKTPEKASELPKVASSTYLVTMVDFAQPGDLGVFIDEDQIRLMEDRMARLGYMDANSMMLTFNLLRSNDLIWPFVINNYLLGREPFPFDILYWNTDSTNLPAAMQSYYLRNMYLNNKLIEPNGIAMKGVPLDLAEITTPTFMLSTREDHIAPWRSTYAATQLYKGPVTFMLSGSGHIAGVINPPEANKYGYWTNSELPENPDEWLSKATPHKGSWWPEWMKWLDTYAGENVPAREVIDGLEDAPGSYVKARVV